MQPFDYFEELSNYRYLFLKELGEPGRHVFRIRVIEGKVSQTTVPIEIAGKSFGEGYPVNIEADSAEYELTWKSYVLYQITNEIFWRPEPSTDGIVGKSASVYRSSTLLDFATRGTASSGDFYGKLLHFRIACEDHIVDVISEVQPECRKIGPKLKVH
jgi:hypothetical protein